MRASKLIKIDTEYNIRVDRLMRDYACFSSEELSISIKKIEKRLGYDKCKIALEACLAGDLLTATKICLDYYDISYKSQLTTRFGDAPDALPTVKVESLCSHTQTVAELIEISKTIL